MISLLAGCGSGGKEILPAAPIHDVPPGVAYYLVGQVTLMPPDPLRDTIYPIDCDGVALLPGTVIPLRATSLEGSLEFQDGAGDFCGDPTQVALDVTGTDQPRLMGFFLQLPGVQIASLPAAPFPVNQGWSAAINLDITCDRAAQTGIPVTLYVTEKAWPRVEYGRDDELVLTSYQTEVFDIPNNRMRLVPGSPIEGTFSFTGEAGIQLGGPPLKARALVEGCFRMPAACPIQAFPGSAATCP